MTNKEIQDIYKDLEHIEPETVRALRGPDVSSLQVLKDMVIKLITDTDAPFQDFYVFENVVHVLNDIEPDTQKIEGCLPHHVWNAINIMKGLVGEDFGLSDEIKTYIRFIFKDNGLMFLPTVFSVEENPNLKKIAERVQVGNLAPSDEDPIENQALELAKIMYYTENFKSKLS